MPKLLEEPMVQVKVRCWDCFHREVNGGEPVILPGCSCGGKGYVTEDWSLQKVFEEGMRAYEDSLSVSFETKRVGDY